MDLKFYGNVSVSAGSGSGGQLIKKSQADGTYNILPLAAIGWRAQALPNATNVSVVCDNKLYRCNKDSLSWSDNQLAPSISSHWDEVSFTEKASYDYAGFVKVGKGFGVSNNSLGAVPATKSSIGVVQVGNGLFIKEGKTSIYSSRRPLQTIAVSYITPSRYTTAFEYTLSNDAVFTIPSIAETDLVEYKFDLAIKIGATVKNFSFQNTVSWTGDTSWLTTTGHTLSPNSTVLLTLWTLNKGQNWQGEGRIARDSKNRVGFVVNVSANQTISLSNPYSSSNLPSSVVVTWGDGSSNTYTTGAFSHTYTTAGQYHVDMYNANGEMPILSFSGLGGALVAVNYADVEWYTSATYLSIEEMFKNCTNLLCICKSLFSKNTDIHYVASCFEGCSKLEKIPAGLFDTFVEAEDFDRCFYGCSSLTSVPVDLFETTDGSLSLSFSDCFYGCSSWVPASCVPYVPPVWEKHKIGVTTTCFAQASEAARSHVPDFYGGTIAPYSASTLYTYKDRVYIAGSDYGLPTRQARVYTSITGPNIGNTPPNPQYWRYG